MNHEPWSKFQNKSWTIVVLNTLGIMHFIAQMINCSFTSLFVLYTSSSPVSLEFSLKQHFLSIISATSMVMSGQRVKI